MINKLIVDFNLNTLDNFLQEKNRSYKPDPVDYTYYFESNADVMNNFSDIQKRGDADVDDFGSLAVITAESKSSLSERSGKKIQFEIAKKILKESQADAAIFVFYDVKGDFRFSYINASYEGSKRAFTSFKRYTYFVSSTQTNQTFKSQIEKADFNNIDSILEAFSVEPLNKEFYKNIQDAFYKLVGGSLGTGKSKKEFDSSLKLPGHPANTNKKMYQEFAVRLIGRTIFVWFLKNKVSQNGKPLIPSNWLTSQNVASNKGFYPEYLEPLFFEILNKWQKDRIPNLPDGHEDIPFLNGGLFEAEVEDFYDLNPSTGRNKNINTLVVPDEWIENLFKTLEQFNFTIDENTLNDKEVSIDPEMLGTIFENLLAEIDPDTEKSARNSTGSFYTPREIVDYMVTESLVNYLLSTTKSKEENLRKLFSEDENTDDISNPDEIIEALHKLKTADISCGSGAYPMGILQKMIHALQKLDPNGRKWIDKKVNQIDDPTLRDMVRKKFAAENFDFSRKMGVIQNSIYGVDIQPVATEISRLRCFLTIIVEERIDDTAKNRGIDPLPNLDFKFVTANSLKALPQYDMNLFGQEDLINELSKLRDEYFACNGDYKKELKRKFIELQSHLAHKNMQSHSKAKKTMSTDSQEYLLSNWKPFENICSEWFDPKWMFGLGSGFDIIIGNPPYFQLSKTIPNQQLKFADLYKNDGYETFERTGDIYALFYERGINLLKENGLLCYITSNKWMRAGYGQSLRMFMSSKQPLKLIDMGPGIFSSATVDTNILLVRNKIPKKHKLLAYTLSNRQEAHNLFNLDYITQTDLSDDIWVIMNQAEQKLKKKVEAKGTPLKDWEIQINYGIKTGYNDAFIIDGATKDKLIAEDPKSSVILKPMLRGRDIKRYQSKFADLWLIDSHNGYKTANGRVPSIDINNYKAIKRHLDKHWDAIEKRQDKGSTPYNLRNCAYHEDFNKNKIVYNDITQGMSFHLDEESMVINNTSYYIFSEKNLNFLVAILNSKVIEWYFRNTSTQLGGRALRMFTQFLELLPIPQITEAEQKPLEALAKKIITAKEQGKDTTALEEEVDLRVYKLYGLTFEEVLIVDPTFADRMSEAEYESK